MRKHEKMNADWVAVLEVLRELQQQPYVAPVGRTIFQKICYVLTEIGVPTGFDFGKGSYGPFSDDIKRVLHDFANRNWVIEQQMGHMMALRVGPQYEKDRSKFQEQIRQHQEKVAKVVDLFSRIKSTEQAEEVFTVLYASRQLTQADPEREITDEELLAFILYWKKSWNTEEKKAAISSAIRNLVILGWMRARISESVDEAAA